MSTPLAYIPSLSLSRQPGEPNLDKLGGLPEGLPPRLWPVCRECDNPMTLCAQLDHAEPRLDLGRAGRRLFVFQCEEPESAGSCETWEQDSGANAAFIVEPEDLLDGPTLTPHPTTPILAEVRIQAWVLFEEQVERDRGNEYGVHRFDTRVGGEPAWVQHANEVDTAHWRFLAQFSSRPRFLAPPAEDHPQLRRFESVCTMDAANYGGGNGYVFVERNATGRTPRATFFWQC